MRVDHPFRLAGGARCVKDESAMLRIEGERLEGIRLGCDELTPLFQKDDVLAVGQASWPVPRRTGREACPTNFLCKRQVLTAALHRSGGKYNASAGIG